MSGIKHISDWKTEQRSMDPHSLTPGHASHHHRSAREAYPSPLAHPGPYVVEAGTMEEAALRGRHLAPMRAAATHAPRPSTDPKKGERIIYMYLYWKSLPK